MEHRLVISNAALRDLVARLSAEFGRREIWRAGVSRLANRTEYLLHPLSGQGQELAEAAGRVIVRGVVGREGFEPALRAEAAVQSGVIFALGMGAAAGRISGIHVSGRDRTPLDEVAVIGPGMPTIRRESTPARNAGEISAFSRTIAALGEQPWSRFTSLRFVVVGCGRSGQLLATALARIGVLRLTLLDPDQVEPHNVAEGAGIKKADEGKSKVQALGAFLQRYPAAAPEVASVTESIFSLSSLVALKAADFVVCSVDNAAARIATDFLAKLYLKPLVDVGTGILENGRTRRMGADIRLVLPGRCLQCFGGVPRNEDMRQLTFGSLVGAGLRDWRDHRAGSLRSLNQVATGLALRLMEEFVGGRLKESTWMQLDMQESGIPQLEHRLAPELNNCPLCRVTGLGDGGIHLMPSVLGEE